MVHHLKSPSPSNEPPCLSKAFSIAATLLLLLLPIQIARAEHTFVKPDRIRYDGQCFTIDGKDTMIYSGAFHYFRCPRPLWPDRFAKIKAAGFNTVETYIPWNRCEEAAPTGLDDFSKINVKDADDWMTMAESYGLNIIIRPGPYICAEWDRGGFPGWLLTKRPSDFPLSKPWLRTDEPTFVAWSRHWYDAVCPMIARHQITHKEPGQHGVILFQIENEYDYSRFPDAVRTKYLAALSDAAVAKGINVPQFTCWTSCVRGSTDPSVSRAFDSANFYVGYNVAGTARDLNNLHKKQPDAPVMVTEMQGGWFTAPHDPMPVKPDADIYRGDLGPNQIQNLELFAIENGATISNYYMLFGGTNLGFSDGGIDIATCYDYSAPIRENGGVGEKYQRVAAIGLFLQEHGARLARSKAVACDETADQPDVTVAEREAADGGRYFFVRTNQHDQPRKGVARVTDHGAEAKQLAINYDLEPFGSKVLYLPPGETDAAHGQWWPKPAPRVDRPSVTDLPEAVVIHETETRDDAPYTDWKAVDGKSAVALGINDRRLVYYNATVTLPANAPTGGFSLIAEVSGGDGVGVQVNGSPIRSMTKGRLDLESLLHAGDNRIDLLYENIGYANFDSAQTPTEKMERMGGITALRLVQTPAVKPDGGRISEWKMHLLDSAGIFVPVPAGFQPDALNPLPELQPNFDDSSWKVDSDHSGKAEQLREHQVAAFRGTIDLTPAELAAGETTVAVSRMDDGGWVYVNGQLVGRGTKWDQAYSFEAAKALKVGRNVIVVVIRNENGAGGLGRVRLITPDRLVADLTNSLRYSDHSAGDNGHWVDSPTDANGWQKQAIPESNSASDPAVAWRRLSFELPASRSNIWVPWLLRLHTTADGTVSLNGHPIGRYYHGTPQTDVFLPGCWLNTGPDQRNALTLQLHRAEVPIAITSAKIIPAIVYAEKK